MKQQKIDWFIPPEETIQLRTSALKMFLRCPAQCLFRYFKGLIVMPNSALTFGSCGHKSAEHQNKYKLKKGRDVKLSVLQDVFNEEFKSRKKKTKWLKKEKPERIKDFGIKKVIPVYYNKLAKKTKPKLVEEPFKIKISGCNAVVTGTMDLITKALMIDDYKFKGRSPKWDEAIKSFQGKIYQIGFETVFGHPPAGFNLNCIIKKKEPEVVIPIPGKITQSEKQQVLATVQHMIMQMRLGLFYPRSENNYFCSKNSCGYWMICQKGAWRILPKEIKTYNANDAEEEDED